MTSLSKLTTLFYTKSSWAHLYRLSEETLEYLWKRVEVANAKNLSYKGNLAGNISRSLVVEDTENVMVNTIFPDVLKTDASQSILELVSPNATKDNIFNDLTGLWVNYQRKYEFNPLHSHGGTISFVIWMKIPYSWENESKLPIVRDSNTQYAIGNFMFVYANEDRIDASQITMTPGMNGVVAFFPSYLSHIVYPFYTSDEERVSISGNIDISVKL